MCRSLRSRLCFAVLKVHWYTQFVLDEPVAKFLATSKRIEVWVLEHFTATTGEGAIFCSCSHQAILIIDVSKSALAVVLWGDDAKNKTNKSYDSYTHENPKQNPSFTDRVWRYYFVDPHWEWVVHQIKQLISNQLYIEIWTLQELFWLLNFIVAKYENYVMISLVVGR